MNRYHKQRLIYIVVIGLSLSLGLSLILFALKQNINVFVTPSQLHHMSLATSTPLRLGGMVKKESVHRSTHDLTMTFVITDYQHEIKVQYKGVLPDLFKEQKGVIAEGVFKNNQLFIASRVLAKHDENYMPKQVYQALRQGQSS